MRLLLALWLACFAGTFPVAWTWPSTNVDGSPLTDLDHGRFVLYRCRTDSLVRRTPPLKPLWIARRDSIVLPKIPAAGLQGLSAEADIINVADGHQYQLQGQAVRRNGNMSPIVSLTFPMPAVWEPPPPPVDTSSVGIVGTYYAGQSRNTLVGTRRDGPIDFAWGSGTAMPGLPVDFWSAQWTGKLVIPTTGAYTLYVETQSGAQLAVDGTMRIDRLGDFPLTEYSATWTMAAGEHVIDLVYTARTGNAAISLKWASATIPKQVIPRGALK